VASVQTADAIAMKLGIEKAAMVRVRWNFYALTEAMDEPLRPANEELIPLAGCQVSQELIRTLDLELRRARWSQPGWRNAVCFLAGLHRAGASS
jgi:exodeoxyribonuclease V alpha subunit